MGQATTDIRHAVLVIEDEPVLRLDAIDMVERAGFDAVEAMDAADAIRILETRLDIRIVYMDLDMPNGVRGIEIAAAIRDRWPPIEIILTAAFFSHEDVTLPVRSEFYPKPYVRNDIMSAMRRLGRRQGSDVEGTATAAS